MDIDIEELGLEEDYPSEEHGVNPFLAFTQFDAVEQEFNINTFSIRKKGDEKYTDGKHSSGWAIPIDIGRSCKFFQTAATQALIFKLDNSGLRLLMFILSRIRGKTDRIRINTVDYMKLAGIKSFKTFYYALNNLRQEGVIAKYKKDIFWINPNVLFSGNRLKQYPDKINIIKHVKTNEEIIAAEVKKRVAKNKESGNDV